MKVSKTEREESLAKLREWIKPGDTVFTVLDHVSKSGMSRDIRVVLLKIDDNGKPYMLHPNYAVSRVLGIPQAKKGDGLKMGGCGMDMGFQLVYLLGSALWPDGTPEPHGTRNGEPCSDGGYALKQQWL